MAITLEEIVTHLTSIGDEPCATIDIGNYPTSLQDGDIESINNFSDWIKSIFKKWKDDIKVMGLHDNLMYVPIMTCIDVKFRELELAEKKKYINNLQVHLCKEISKNDIFESFEYKKLGWKKNNLVAMIKSSEQTMEILKIIADYFNINIFVIDNEERQIQIHHGMGQYSPFRENVFLIKTKTGFDPMCFSGESITPRLDTDNETMSVNYNDSFLREFIQTHEKILICPSYDLKKDAAVIRPFSLLKAGELVVEYEEDVDDVFCKKMKLNKIQKIAKKCGIPIKMGKKFKTKNILQEEIKEKLQNGDVEGSLK